MTRNNEGVARREVLWTHPIISVSNPPVLPVSDGSKSNYLLMDFRDQSSDAFVARFSLVLAKAGLIVNHNTIILRKLCGKDFRYPHHILA